MNHTKNFIIVGVLILLSACSGTNQAYYQTLKLAFSKQENVRLTLPEVQQSKTDLAQVTRGDKASITMALAYLEEAQHKWVSADKAMLILEKGRIVRTIGLEEDLLYISNTHADPLKALAESSGKNWTRKIDWANDKYGHTIQSSFNDATADTLEIFNQSFEVVKYIENVRYTAPSKFIQLDRQWQNVFWVDKQSGILLKSKQKLAPHTELIEMLYLSRIARLKAL